MALNVDKPCFASDGDAPAHRDSSPTEGCYTAKPKIGIAFSTASPYFVQSVGDASQVLISQSTKNLTQVSQRHQNGFSMGRNFGTFSLLP